MSSINQNPIVLQEEETVMALADKAIGDSLEQGSFDFAAEVISSYRSLTRASELGVSKVLHGVNRYWHDIEHQENESFFEWSGRATGYVHLTVERHVAVWEMISGNYIPKPYRHLISTKTIRQLFKIYSLVVVPVTTLTHYDFIEQDYLIEDSDWLALSEAQDERRVADIVSKIKGKERNKNFMSLKIDRRGDVYVYQNNESEYVFSLPINSSNPLLVKTCRRVMDGAGITEKDE